MRKYQLNIWAPANAIEPISISQCMCISSPKLKATNAANNTYIGSGLRCTLYCAYKLYPAITEAGIKMHASIRGLSNWLAVTENNVMIMGIAKQCMVHNNDMLTAVICANFVKFIFLFFHRKGSIFATLLQI